MSKLVDQNVHASNTLVIRIRGREVGRATGLDPSADFGTERVDEGIGSVMAAEHVPLRYSVEFSLSTFFIRVRSTSPNQAGIQDVLGVPVNEQILLAEPFDLVVLDKVTNQVVLKLEQCTWSSVSFSIRQGAIAGKDARAAGIRMVQAPQYDPKV